MYSHKHILAVVVIGLALFDQVFTEEVILLEFKIRSQFIANSFFKYQVK